MFYDMDFDTLKWSEELIVIADEEERGLRRTLVGMVKLIDNTINYYVIIEKYGELSKTHHTDLKSAVLAFNNAFKG